MILKETSWKSTVGQNHHCPCDIGIGWESLIIPCICNRLWMRRQSSDLNLAFPDRVTHSNLSGSASSRHPWSNRDKLVEGVRTLLHALRKTTAKIVRRNPLTRKHQPIGLCRRFAGNSLSFWTMSRGVYAMNCLLFQILKLWSVHDVENGQSLSRDCDFSISRSRWNGVFGCYDFGFSSLFAWFNCESNVIAIWTTFDSPADSKRSPLSASSEDRQTKVFKDRQIYMPGQAAHRALFKKLSSQSGNLRARWSDHFWRHRNICMASENYCEHSQTILSSFPARTNVLWPTKKELKKLRGARARALAHGRSNITHLSIYR
jgi:hypothetical protein